MHLALNLGHVEQPNSISSQGNIGEKRVIGTSEQSLLKDYVKGSRAYTDMKWKSTSKAH